MHASQHCTTLRDPQGDLISSRSFESRLSVIVVECLRVWLYLGVLCLGHKLGVITQLHSQTVDHTLGTADVIPDPHASTSRVTLAAE